MSVGFVMTHKRNYNVAIMYYFHGIRSEEHPNPKIYVLYSRTQSEESPLEIKTGHRKRISFQMNSIGKICALNGAVRIPAGASALLA